MLGCSSNLVKALPEAGSTFLYQFTPLHRERITKLDLTGRTDVRDKRISEFLGTLPNLKDVVLRRVDLLALERGWGKGGCGLLNIDY